MSNYCEDCGSKMYSGRCVNCHEELYIADQHIELGTWNDTSEEFKKKVDEQELQIANKKSA